MTIKQTVKAIYAVANAEQFDRKRYDELAGALIDAGICPSCAANDGDRCKATHA